MGVTSVVLATIRVAEAWTPANLLGAILFCLAVVTLIVGVSVARRR